MYYTVYKVTNKINGKFYIGAHKTKNLDDGYMGSGVYLRRAQEAHGLENFEKEVLYFLDTAEEMYKKEAEIVDENFILREDTYNLARGGLGGGFDYVNENGLNLYRDDDGNILNGTCGHGLQNLQSFEITAAKMKEDGRLEEWKAKISRLKKEYFKHNPGTFTGKKHTQETKDKIGSANSIHQSGSKNSQYGKMWITNGVSSKKIFKDEAIPEGWAIGRVISPEARAKKEQIKQNKLREKEKKLEEKKTYLRSLYEIYKEGGIEAVKESGYQYSQVNLVNTFARHLPEFVPQNGKKRNRLP